MLNAICTQNENFYYGIWIWGPRGKIDLAIEELNTERPMLVFFLACYRNLSFNHMDRQARTVNTVLNKQREGMGLFEY
jgi:hypothetical protein